MQHPPGDCHGATVKILFYRISSELPTISRHETIETRELRGRSCRHAQNKTVGNTRYRFSLQFSVLPYSKKQTPWAPGFPPFGVLLLETSASRPAKSSLLPAGNGLQHGVRLSSNPRGVIPLSHGIKHHYYYYYYRLVILSPLLVPFEHLEAIP
jgi:hypothetical protein